MRPLDYLLEESVRQYERLAVVVAAVNTLGALVGAQAEQLAELREKVGGVDLEGTRTARELAVLRTAAVASVEELRRITAGELQAVDVMVRDGDGNVSAVLRRAAPAEGAAASAAPEPAA